MTAPDTDPLDDQFAALLEQGEQVLAAGTPWRPEDDPAVPPQLVPRLQGARDCLALLQALWPARESRDAAATVSENGDSSGHADDFTVDDALQQVGRYTILGELGRGGMGIVYRAWQADLRRVVALKMTLAGALAGARERERFRRETEVAAALRHPHIVQVYEAGEHAGCPYFTQEYMDGGTLGGHTRGRPQPIRESAAIVETLAGAVQYAHECGVIHRDLKPSNVLLQKRSGARRGGTGGPPSPPPAAELSAHYFIKVGDFGLAREMDEEATRTGLVMGTPSYMAPEQAAGRSTQVGPLADVYGLGALLYELLTGRPPFKGKTSRETLEQVRQNEPVSPRAQRREVPRDLERICLKCLEKAPRRRYDSARALADDLGRFLAGEPVQARRPPVLERLVRRVRRRPALTLSMAVATVVLSLTVVAAAYFKIELKRPLRHGDVQAVYEALRAGKAVELVGATGMPPTYRWQRGDPRLPNLAQEGVSELFIPSFDLALLELLPQVPCDHYRVRAEVWPNYATEPGLTKKSLGHVGIYFAHVEYSEPGGQVDEFLSVTVDLGVNSRASVSIWRDLQQDLALQASFPIHARQWCQLTAEVHPNWVRGSCQGQWIQGRNKTEKLPRLRQTESMGIEELLQFIGSPKGVFQPRGALGICVRNDRVQIRNVVIEPIDPNP